MIRTWIIDAGAQGQPSLVTREPAPAALTGDQVLVRVEATVLGPRERAALLAKDQNIIPGGAAVGVVVDCGEAATQLIDKRVLVGPLMPCGECDACRHGGAPACPRGERLGTTVDGTIASHVVARGRWLLALEDSLDLPDPRAAILAREAATAYAAFAHAGVSPGEPVIIVGDGIISVFTAQVALAKGAEPFIVSDRATAWRSLLGDSETSTASTADELKQLVCAAGHGDKPWRIFETSAEPHARQLALSLTKPGSTVVVLSRDAAGAATNPAPLPFEPWICHHANVVGIAGAHPDFAAEVVAAALREQLDISTTTELVSLDQLPEVVARSEEIAPVPILDLRAR